MEPIKQGADALFILLGAIMVLAMHAGFAFLELGTVRKKNQVNALVKILVDFAVSTIAYFFVGYTVAYGVAFFTGAETLAAALGEERDVIEDVIEPYLVQQGFVQRTPRGRLLTDEAYRYLGLTPLRREGAQLDLLAGKDDAP